MCTVYRNRLCVQELSYIVDFNRLSTQNLLISHGTCKDTRNTQKISIQSKGGGPPACTCTISRGTTSNEITLNTRILWINLCKILSICSYTCIVYYMYFSMIFIILLCLSLPLAQWVVPVGTPAKIDGLLLDWVFTQKLCNNLSKVHNNIKNISERSANYIQGVLSNWR